MPCPRPIWQENTLPAGLRRTAPRRCRRPPLWYAVISSIGSGSGACAPSARRTAFISEHDPERLVIDPGYLGIISDAEAKVWGGVFINLVEVPKENWSNLKEIDTFARPVRRAAGPIRPARVERDLNERPPDGRRAPAITGLTAG